ncbi:MAG: lytic transglycosylase domain-containing protein [Acidimicrobiia bacterium]
MRLLRRGLLLALTLFVVFATPVRADPPECDQAWDRFGVVVRQEARLGLTVERLDEINTFIPIVETCADESTGDISWSSGVDAWGPLVAVYFRHEDVERALCLMALESAGDPGARNPTSGASGLMQVMPFWAGHFGYGVDALFDPFVNLEIAAQIRDQQGWEAWSPYLRGSCR